MQGPMYVGTGCLFRRFALYGFDPPRVAKKTDWLMSAKKKKDGPKDSEAETRALREADEEDGELDVELLQKSFGNSTALAKSVPVAEFQGRPLADHPGVKHGRPPGALRLPREPLDSATVSEAVSVISCW